MTAPLVAYVAIAGQRDFDVPFPYLNPSHVEVRVNSITVPILEWVSQSRLRLAVPPGDKAYVEVRRNTPIDDALVDFQNGAVLTEEDLNTAVLQLLYKQQEVVALYEMSLLAAQVRLASANGLSVSPEDVANQLANLVLEDEVLANFRQRINDIDNLALTGSLQAGTIEQIAQNIADPLTGNSSLKTSLDNLRVDHESLSGVVDGLLDLGNGEGISAIISAESSARAAGDTALAATIALIGAKSGTSNAFILDLNNIRVSPTETLATRLSTLTAADAAANAAITTEQNVRTAGLSAEAATRQQLGAALQTAINNEAASRAAAITTEQTVRANAITAEASQRQSLGVSLTNTINGVNSNLSASINAESSARVSADGALASTIALIGAKSGDGASFILDENKVKVAGGVSLGVRLSGIDSSIGSTNAAVVSEQNARASADNALSNSINVVSTNVGNLSATVSTLSSSVNGISAKYGVKLNVNGHITGFVQNNDGTTGDFLILADRFAIVDPNNGSPFTPFEVSGGIVRIKEANIGTLNIGKLATGLLNGDMNVGTGRIIFDNGAVMKVQGVGFGTSNQFIEWFGPKRAIHTCSESNATYYLKTDGSAYFGGSLSTGLLKNAVTTSSTSASAAVTTGNFGSNGGARQVSVSYSYRSYEVVNGQCPVVPAQTATIHLYRGVDASGTFLAALNVNGGSYTCRPGFGASEPGQWQVNAGGSLTYTDNAGGLSCSYYVQIVSRSMPVGAEVTQSLSVISVEG